MYAIKKMLVALDLSDIDTVLVRYAFNLAEILGIEAIVLSHVVREADLADVEANIEGGLEGLAPQLKAMALASGTVPAGVELSIEVISGHRVSELLAVSKKHGIDLIIAGRKNITQTSGDTLKQMARRALCSFVTVPENAKPVITKVLMPVDFSEMSEIAFKRILQLSKKADFDIICLHVYSLPQGYTASGKTQEEYAEIMRHNAEKRYKLFIDKFEGKNINVKPKFCLDIDGSAAKIIYNIALVENADLIVMGSRGRTSMAAAFLGSTTEKLLMHNLSIPTLVLKSKVQNMGFFEALLKL